MNLNIRLDDAKGAEKLPNDDCYFVAVEEGREIAGICEAEFDAFEVLARLALRERQANFNAVIVRIPRLGRTIDRAVLAADGHYCAALRWPDGAKSDPLADGKPEAMERGVNV